MMIRWIVFGFLIFCTVSGSLDAQVTDELIQKELAARGIDEEVFRSKMRERGIDYTSVDQIPASQMAELQQIVQEVISEIELLQNPETPLDNKQPENVITPPAETARESVREHVEEALIEGASLEEAVAEEAIRERPNLPPGKIYGQEIFRDGTLKVFRQADNIKARSSYQVGPGDEITISIYGTSIYENTFMIDANGYIKPSLMPRIYLKGLAFEAATRKLRSTFSRFYRFRNDEFEVSLRHARTISVGIFGEVFNPGTYTISSINSAFNAIVASGGPTDIGTIRNIKWIKENGVVEQIDVYQYMNDPTVAESFYLNENDIIQIPIAERVVGIAGAVNRPMRYELVEGEDLMQLIDYAGGLTPDAYRQLFQLKRFENDQQQVIDIAYSDLVARNGDFSLKNGDQITVRLIPAPYRNFVEINGAVLLPGEYQFEEGMRVLDLIRKGTLEEGAERSEVYLRRSNLDGTSNFNRVQLNEVLQNSGSPENVLLVPGDRITVYSRSQFVDQYNVDVNGAVRNPGSFQYDPSSTMRVRDLIQLAGGLEAGATAFGYLTRINLSTNEPEYIRVDIEEVIGNPASNDNIALQARDQLLIQNQTAFIEEATLRVAGAVRSPGTYRYDESMTMKDLITLANGLRLEAAANRVEVSRIVIEQNEPTATIIATLALDEDLSPIDDPGFSLQPYDQVFVRTVPEFEFQKTVYLSGEVRFPGPYTLIADNERITSVIDRAGGLTREGFPEGATLVREQDGIGPIVIQLAEVLNNERSESNIILQNGDAIDVPKIKDIVILSGAINTTELYRSELIGSDNAVNVIYDGEKSARYYIDQFAGGFADNGDRSKVTVEYPNGEIRKSKLIGPFRVYPKVDKGAIVHVGVKPPKQDAIGGEKEDVDWGRVLSDAVAQATAVLTLILLLDRAAR
ncbi:MAG: SLBB domain-containing protein [Saprospiraceae bacterium]|nr:SLBB domain-containing protein [Saprospiraceae bacterium]